MIRIGIIGMNEGNAHPYSWSAIINGCFDGGEISRRGYPGVATYLHANRDTLGIQGAEVTHVWTQDADVSRSIARSSSIAQVVERLEDMTDQVDAIILARDDAENHVAMSRPFIAAGIPVFIDKPLAINRSDLDWFSAQHAQGKFLMSCSSMRYANECRTAKTELASLGAIELVSCVGKKDWNRYGVHLLEAFFALLDDPKPVSVKHVGKKNKDVVRIGFDDGMEATMHLFKDIAPAFHIAVYGKEGWKMIDIKNSYSMFRDTIIEFLRSVEAGKPRLDFEKTTNIIQTLIGATTSLERGGDTIKL